jgi:hypothetical protein
MALMSPAPGSREGRRVKNIIQLSIMLIEKNKNMTYDLLYKLLKLLLTLPLLVLRGYLFQQLL